MYGTIKYCITFLKLKTCRAFILQYSSAFFFFCLYKCYDIINYIFEKFKKNILFQNGKT